MSNDLELDNSSAESGGDLFTSGVAIDQAQCDDSMNDHERLARSRERNREHARRTRLRKKAQLNGLQARIKELQADNQRLRQAVEECSIASILLGLSGGSATSTSSVVDDTLGGKSSIDDAAINCYITQDGKRRRFSSDDSKGSSQPMKLNINGQVTVIGGSGSGKTHINWKSGVYCDENGVQKQLTNGELEALRRERNRMHAKMTRDRKKVYISKVESTIADLEKENRRLRETLGQQKALQNLSQGMDMVTPTGRNQVDSVPSANTNLTSKEHSVLQSEKNGEESVPMNAESLPNSVQESAIELFSVVG